MLPAETLAATGPAETAATLARTGHEPGDVVLTLGAGDVTEMGPMLARLAAGHAAMRAPHG